MREACSANDHYMARRQQLRTLIESESQIGYALASDKHASANQGISLPHQSQFQFFLVFT
jgi:hypothetical protein